MIYLLRRKRKMNKLKTIGNGLFYTLAVIGFFDMATRAWTDGEVRLIHRFLTLFFPQ